MKKLFAALCLLLSPLLSIAAPTAAQGSAAQEPASAAPLIFYGRGVRIMNEATGAIELWNECGDGMGWRLSPDGEWLARLESNSDVRLCNVYSREVIDVEAPASSEVLGFASYPAWSPDSTQMAWSVSFEGDAHYLFVYTLGDDAAQVLVDDLPESDLRPSVRWGESGILVAVDSQDESRVVAPLYSPSGKVLADDLSNGQSYTEYFWTTDEDGREYLGRYTSYLYNDIIDPVTGDTYFASFELYSPLAPDGLGMWLAYAPEGTHVTLPDGDLFAVADLSPDLVDFIPFQHFDPRNVGISPEGDAFAVFDLDQLIWRDGEVTELSAEIPKADGTGVIWGPTAIRLLGEPMSPTG